MNNFLKDFILAMREVLSLVFTVIIRKLSNSYMVRIGKLFEVKDWVECFLM